MVLYIINNLHCKMSGGEENTNMPDEGTEARNIELEAKVAHLESLLDQNQPAAAAAAPPAPPVQPFNKACLANYNQSELVGERTVLFIRSKLPKNLAMLNHGLTYQNGTCISSIRTYVSTDAEKQKITTGKGLTPTDVMWIPITELHIIAGDNDARRIGELFPGGFATEDGFNILKTVIEQLLEQHPTIAIGNTFINMKGSRQTKTITTVYGDIKHYAPQVPKVPKETSMQMLAQQMMMLMTMGGPAKNTVFSDDGAGSHGNRKRQRSQKKNGPRN
jgi:hypothetical protein